MALKYHPDRNPHLKNPEEAFSKINLAYKILSEYVQSAEFDSTANSSSYEEKDRWGEEKHSTRCKKEN